MVRAAASPNQVGDKQGALSTFFQYVHVLQTYGRRVKEWHYPTYWVTKKLILIGILYLLYLALF
jgi:beta-hydroxylase